MHTRILSLSALFFVFTSTFAQKDKLIPIQPISNSAEFLNIAWELKNEDSALYVFDIDNTLLITNENKFGSDWWYEQSNDDPSLKLGVDSKCLFNVLTPLFYAMFGTTPVFPGQPATVNSLGMGTSRTIGLTSRGYTASVATSTEEELTHCQFGFLQKDSVVLGKDILMLNGVIYSKGQNKGEVLLNYVKKHNYTKIYFFDDGEKNVKNVQNSFSGTGIKISIYHMLIAPKVPYTEEEKAYMKGKLANMVGRLNSIGETGCSCSKP